MYNNGVILSGVEGSRAITMKTIEQKAKKVPTIRFAGFDDEWVEKKLGEMASFSKGMGYSKGDLKENGTPIVLYGRLYTKYETIISDIDTFADAKSNSVYSKGGEVIVPGSGETAEDISIASVVKKSGVLLGGDLNVITPPKNLDSVFLAISISNGKPHSDMAKMAQGKSVVHLHNTDLAEINLPYPNIIEQQKIGSFFSNIDSLISLEQKKYDKLTQVKKSMLEKMFPKEGATVPEIRFTGFTSDWNVQKASKICSITTGKSNTQDQVDGGLYPFFIRSDEPVRSNRYLYDEEAVITIGDGNIGKVFHYVNGKFDLHQRCYKMSDFKDVLGKYFYYFFSTKFYHRAIKMTAKATVDSVRLEMISEMDIQYPENLNEQQKIGSYFSHLDSLISLQQRKLEKLKNIKKSLLEKMFV